MKFGEVMMSLSKNARNESKEGRIAIFLVMLMLSSPMLSLVPSVSASHITDYAVQRDPSFISIGDIDCDDDNDIVSVSYTHLTLPTKRIV